MSTYMCTSQEGILKFDISIHVYSNVWKDGGRQRAGSKWTKKWVEWDRSLLPPLLPCLCNPNTTHILQYLYQGMQHATTIHQVLYNYALSVSNVCSGKLRNWHLFHTRNPQLKVLEHFLKVESCLIRNTSLHPLAKFPDPRNSYNHTHQA